MRVFAFSLAAAACGGGHSTGPDSHGGDSPGSPTTVSVTLANHPGDAAMFSFLAAYQDGSGPWTLAPAPTGDTYSFAIDSPTWALDRKSVV